MKTAVLGDGGWGTTLAILLNNKGYKVSLWSAFSEYAEYLNKKRVNTEFLPGINIPRSISITSDLQEVASGADLIVLAVPSQYMRSVLLKLKGVKRESGVYFLSAAKGIEDKTLMRMSCVIRETLGHARVAVLSGPTISYEVSRGMPAAAVIASADRSLARGLQNVFTTGALRVYVSSDVVGVELGGSLKNVIAIAAGILDGLKLGANAKAGLITRGMVEISRLGVKMGADPKTLFGISGLGDLVTTCTSSYGRNRWLGVQIGRGNKPKAILKKTQMAVEGVLTAKSAYSLSKRYRVEMPITAQVYKVLYQNKPALEAIRDLMSRPLKEED